MRYLKKSLQILSAFIVYSTPTQASWNGDEKARDTPFLAPPFQTGPINVQHELLRYRFAGGMAHRIYGQVIQEANGSRQTNIMCDGELEGHQGNTIVYVQAFPLDENQGQDFQGDYNFMGDLAPEQQLRGLEDGRLLYSDGRNYFLPHVTQERWEGEEHRSVGFLIASINNKRFLERVPHNPLLPHGLHTLTGIDQTAEHRKEIWRQVSINPEVITQIIVPSRTASVPGLGTIAPRGMPQNPGAQQIGELVTSLGLSDQSHQLLTSSTCEGSVFLIGHAGSGKSSLMHLICGDGLRAEPDDIGYLKVVANRELPGILIQDGGEVGTKTPGVIFDPNFNRAIWDCPGFEDPRGDVQEIINAYTLYKLFKGNIKIILVVTESDITDNRGAQFLERLTKIQKMFPDTRELKQLLSLVISRGQLEDPTRLLQNTLQKLPANKIADSKELIEAMIQNKNHMATFIRPKNEGVYETSPALMELLTNRQYVPNPQFRTMVGPSADLLIIQLGGGLNISMAEFLKTEGLRRLISFCRMRIDHHHGTAASLRKSFADLGQTLHSIRETDPASPMGFVDSLRPIMEVKDMETMIQHLDFLYAMNPTIAYRTAEWRMALGSMIEHVQLLSSPAEITVGDVLTLQGIFLGVTDLRKAYMEHPNATHLQAFALNTLFLEDAAPLIAPGVSISFVAPKWQSVHPLTLNLSGKVGAAGGNGEGGGGSGDGKAGTDGKPGLPGQSAGHFYGQAFSSQPLNIMVIANGGQGGRGGNGGSGGAGRSGVNATRQPQGFKTIRNGIRCMEYSANGADGVKGGDAGRGGHHGLAGFTGQVLLKDVHIPSDSIENKVRVNGDNGSPGGAGPGGVHGCHTRFILKGKWHDKKSECLPEDATSRGTASHGRVPAGFNANGLKPPVEQAFSGRDVEKAFVAWYMNQALNPLIGSFIRVMPNIEH